MILKVSWMPRRSKKTFLKFDKSWNVFKPSKYFSMIFKSLLECQKVQKTLLKFYKSWNVLEASKYISMIFKSLLECQKVPINFVEVEQVLECLGSFKIYFYDF